MKKMLILFLLPTFFSLYADNYLFINTYPIRAKVFADGKEVNSVTPCLIKDITGIKKLILKKEGYKDYTLSKIDIESAKVNINMIPSSFDLYFPEKTKYKIDNTQIQGPVYVTKIASGKYDLNIVGDKVQFDKSSSFRSAEVGLGVAFGISFCTMITAIALSEYYNSMWNQNKNIKDKENETYFDKQATIGMDYLKYAAIGTTAATGIALISVVSVDVSIKFNSKKSKMEIVNKKSSSQDTIFYETAVQFLSMGEISKSTNILESTITLYPDSDLIPIIYYQLGQNYFLTKEYDKAIEKWETFIRDYPVPDYYDYVVKNLSDIYYQQKDLTNARNLLDRIVFTDNILNRETIYASKGRLDVELYNAEKKQEFYDLAEKEYMFLIDNFQASPSIDMYFLQLVKLYNLQKNADKITNLKEKVTSSTVIDEALKKVILSYFK